MARARDSLAEGLLRVLVVALAVILVLLPIHAFLSTWGGTAIGPLLVWKSWKELLLIGLLPLVLLYCRLRPDVAKAVSNSWVTRLAFLYVLIQVGFAVISSASLPAVAAGLLMNLRFVAILLLALIVTASGGSWVRAVKRWLEPWLFITTIALAVMAIAQVTLVPKDFLAQFGYDKTQTIAPYILVDDNESALRAFATMRGPNPLGAYLILPLMLALLAVVREPRNLLAGAALGLGAVAVVLTSSRSAWLGVLAALVVMIAFSMRFRKLITGTLWAIIPLVAAGFIFLWAAVNVPSLRLAVFHSSSTDFSLTEGSIDKHWQASLTGIGQVWQEPLGHGVGTAGPASFYNENAAPNLAENYYIQVAQETGLVGLGIFLLLLGTVAVKLWQRRSETWPRVLLASFIGLAVVNLFLHGWSDDPTAMTWFAVAGLFLIKHDTGVGKAKK